MSAYPTQPATLDVAILVFDDVEALDLGGPYEVFTTATRMQQRLHPGAPDPFSVRCVARSLEPIRARAGMRVLPDADFATCGQPDVLIVPGGVVDAARACGDTVRWIAQAAAGARLVASVCTGAFLLAEAGVVTDATVTTHWEDIADLRAQFPQLDVRDGVRWVAPEGTRIATSAGISAGIDMSLHLVQRLVGAELAHRTARQMDYPWTHNPPSDPSPPARA